MTLEELQRQVEERGLGLRSVERPSGYGSVVTVTVGRAALIVVSYDGGIERCVDDMEEALTELGFWA